MLTAQSRQAGLSFIELLISMVIGIVLLGGMLTVYMAGKRSYSDGEQLTMMDESARNAIDILKRHLEHAGYASVTGVPVTDYVLTPNTLIVGKSVNSSNNVQKSADGSGSGGDIVGIRFKADSRIHTDCAENNLENNLICTGLVENEVCAPILSETDSLIYNSFLVKVNDEKNTVGDKIPLLYCQGSLGPSVSVVQNIENMQVNYGVDTNNDKVADRYLTATQLNTEGLWNKIISIQVALLVRSRDPFYSSAKQESFTLLDKTLSSFNDRYRRAVYTTTIRLRNLEG
ncbi:MAG: PilW family protein [Thiofilum sp.]|uniref:PilW family protein n=1 Tax=Thiofilum sp. TaxID=2212733 RepID=UPI0025DDE4DB|nr:PilW family protein [Thiofilum sp.]MBK8453294.1 PilW family protein [Thiofilum sp.]